MVALGAIGSAAADDAPLDGARTLAERASEARTPAGEHIGWRAHLIDGETTSGVALRGSDAQRRTVRAFQPARADESPEVPLPAAEHRRR